MEINPYDARLRMLQQIDGVQMQREAAPDEETAGCPGCPYFWTCPVPHRGEEVKPPQEIDLADVQGVLGPRREYAPRDESDVGWTDIWLDEDGLPIDTDITTDPAGEPAAEHSAEATAELRDRRLVGDSDDHSDAASDTGTDTDTDTAPSERRGWRSRFRRRR